MRQLKATLGELCIKLSGRNIAIVFVLLSYVFFTVVCMGPSVWRCTDTVTGLGDSTGGPIWRASIEPQQPLLGGYQKVTNYPSGESLYSPVGIVSVEQTVMMKGLSKIVGPVCAYNAINIIGYLSTSMVMFAFVVYLIRNRWLAWLAGLATAFTPYAQTKVGGHPSYGYASLLIGALWLTLLIIKHKKWTHAIGLSVVLAGCAYFDPYFILLVGTVMVPTLFAWAISAIRGYRRGGEARSDSSKTLKMFLLAFASFLVLMTPLIFIRIKDADVINSTTGAIRGDIKTTAMMCSNFPIDYLLPDPYNVHLVKILGNGYVAKNISMRNWCGFGESRVSVSLTVIGVTTIGLIVFAWEYLNSRRKKIHRLTSYNTGLVLGSVGLIALSAVLIGLPPEVGKLTTPSGIIIMLTNTWRIFSREQLVLNLALVILFSIVLQFFYLTFKGKLRNWTKVIFVLLTLLIIGEYQIHNPFGPPTFSFKKDVPSIYHRVRDDPEITAVAEYPLDRLGIEADSIVYYLTMQLTHGKSLMNSASIANKNEKLHIAIKDLTDPQTIPALRALGLRYVLVHGLTAEQVLARTDQLEVLQEETPPVYGLTMFRSAPTNTFILARIKDGPKLKNAITIQKGFAVNNDIMKSSLEMEYEAIPDTELTLTPVNRRFDRVETEACFDIKMSAPGDTSQTEISVNGTVQKQLLLTDSYSSVAIKARPGDRIVINNLARHNTRLNNLGCAN